MSRHPGNNDVDFYAHAAFSPAFVSFLCLFVVFLFLCLFLFGSGVSFSSSSSYFLLFFGNK